MLQGVLLPAVRMPTLRELRWGGAIDAQGLRVLAALPELRVLQPGTPRPVILGTHTNSETRALAAALLALVWRQRCETLDLSHAGWEDVWFDGCEPSAGTRQRPRWNCASPAHDSARAFSEWSPQVVT